MSKIKLRVFFLTFFVLQSCAKVSYQSSNRVPTFISNRAGHHQPFSVIGSKDFYLWGLIPSKHEVDLSEVMSSAGLLTSAGLQIEDFQTFSDKVWSLVTLGLYLPRHYRVNGWGQRQEDEDK